MDTEKRLLWFLILTLLILFSFNRFFLGPQKRTLSPPLPQKEIAGSQKEIAEETPSLEECSEEPWENSYWNVTLCVSRGYVSKLQIKPFKEALLYQNLFFIDAQKPFEVKTSSQEISFTSPEFRKKIVVIKPYLWEIEVDNPLKKDLEICSFEEDKGFYKRYQEFFYKENSSITRIPYSKIKNRQTFTNLQFLGLRDRYYTLAILNPPPGEYFLEKRKKKLILVYKPSLNASSFKAQIFIGPQEMRVLQDYGLTEIMYFGFFHGIARLILKALYFGFQIFKNWGVAIIFVSSLIYLLLFPLTIKSSKSMKKMQELQPQIEELRKKYKDNPQKLNKEILELYKQYKINPLGGCLPLFLQIPIFFALYQVLIRSVEIKGARFLWIKDLSLPDYLIKLPLSLPIVGDGIHLLPLLMVGLMFFQQKLTTPKTSASEQQKLMTFIFPLVFGFIFYRFPSGLVLYWVCNSLFTFIYQLRLARVK